MSEINWEELTAKPSEEAAFHGREELRENLEADQLDHVTAMTYTMLEERGESRYVWEVWPDRFDAVRGWHYRVVNLTTGASHESKVPMRLVDVIPGTCAQNVGKDVRSFDHGMLRFLPKNGEWHRAPMEKPLNFLKDRDRIYLMGCEESPLLKLGYSRDPVKRRDEVQHMSPVRLELVWTAPGGRPLEAALHVRFVDRRAHGEWFDFKLERAEAVRLVEAEADRLRGRVERGES